MKAVPTAVCPPVRNTTERFEFVSRLGGARVAPRTLAIRTVSFLFFFFLYIREY